MNIQWIADHTGVRKDIVAKVIALLEEGATIPFIARYRKEQTGSLDEVKIADIKQQKEKLEKLEKRKVTILDVINEQGKLTPELKDKINRCYDPILLEDIYLPFKKSRKTKADTAIALGLEPLARMISAQKSNDLHQQTKRFLSSEVKTAEEALEGARYIIAAWINENQKTRDHIRQMYQRYALVESSVVKKKKEVAIKYKDYFDFSESLNRIPSHRILAILRGENEGYLKAKIAIDQERAFEKLARYYIKSNGACAAQLELAIKDALKRLLLPSLENESKKTLKEKADIEAIQIFSKNLRQLLLAAPMGQYPVLALDPGFRSGCKVVALDEFGTLLEHSTIFPHPPQSKDNQAWNQIKSMIDKYKIKHIAIGNGTAGRESLQFLKQMNCDCELYMVNEDGASIYSASAIAREEFPDLDITIRGAISIGRRLMDPLSELVKIDAKSIGVGQYQHDVNQTLLQADLDNTVSSCVNAVGINLNSASQHLLQYVSGLGPTIAKNIVKYRAEIGGFKNRKQLLKVPRMGAKAYEQAAGFLRVKSGENSLDNTGIHPERYTIVKKIMKAHDIRMNQSDIKERLSQIKLAEYVNPELGKETLQDIIKELSKPGLDPRGEAEVVNFSDQIKSIEDVKAGMKLTGIVNNVTKFGAFVDLGIKESGLIHVSQMADRFVSDPSTILSLNQSVTATVIEVDVDRKRISLSLKE